MYRRSKKRKSPIRKSIRRSIRRKPCKSGQRRSRQTGRCGKYIKVINDKKTQSECKKKLSKKIKINMEELKTGKFSSRSQAIAVSYSQIKKKYPDCNQYFYI